MLKAIAIGLATLAASGPALAQPCVMSAKEQAWVEQALAGWELVRRDHLKIEPLSDPVIVLFNDRCRFEARAGAEWRSQPHAGVIELPNGEEVEAQVTSATMSNESTGEPFFVMALPGIWEAAGIVKGGDWGLLTGVFLHEFSHATQAPVLRPSWKEAESRYTVPEELDDDAIQRVFQKNPAFVAAVEKERDLLFEAANEADENKAKSLARQALALRDSRQKRWFVGENAVWKPYDDIFLTMEGFGQWVAYAWLSDPRGGGLTPAQAQDKMRGSRKWWSQDTGFSLFLVIDRFVPNWSARAFGADPVLATDLWRQAVSEGAPLAG